ncbi:PREDICTED: B-box domain protein 31-like [Tarenaya hassleriana]|uniref:B-box domain protein 31-like n=1 Tax=Tarenaya hassleriana TaxID=28532 RepID=UPI00053C3905|nr:PREDICTED: B-box domain protein 31-like [Tarenaya hassleriana]
MCKGVEEEKEIRSGGGERQTLCPKQSAAVRCELCGWRASLYCDADAAFLCKKCDRLVHQANFLAGRHVRRVLCTSCQKLTRRCIVGEGFSVVLPLGVTRQGEEDSDNNHTAKVPFVFI